MSEYHKKRWLVDEAAIPPCSCLFTDCKVLLKGVLGPLSHYSKYVFLDQTDQRADSNGAPSDQINGKKKEKVTLRKKESRTNLTHPWLACCLKAHSGEVLGLDFSPNGKFMASCSEGNTNLHDVCGIVVCSLQSNLICCSLLCNCL